LSKRSAKARAETRAEIRRAIAESKLAIDPNSWIPFFEIYRLDATKSGTRDFLTAVNKHCNSRKLPLKRFFLTLEKNRISGSQVTALSNANRSYSRRLDSLIGKTSKRALEEKKGLEERIARNQRIISVIEVCLEHEGEAKRLQKTRGSLAKVEGLRE